MEQSRLEGGYLFCGPEGMGKKMTAKEVAKAVNCLETAMDSCDRCISCLKIANNQHPDIHFIANEDAEIKIEYIRQLQKDISLRPYEGKRKVFIIDNAHKLTAEASNAVLKILEEPPKGTLIILISDKPQLLFKTIISRCKAVKFFPLKRIELEGVLKKEFGFEDIRAHFLAYFSEGRLGCALRLKDADILQKKNTIIDQFSPQGRTTLDNLSLQNRQEVRGHLNILAAWFRDIYLLKTGIAHSEVINSDRIAELLKLMNRFSFSDLDEILRLISNSILYLEQNINVKLLLMDLKLSISHT